MAGRWFRFYDTAVNDPKVQRLSPELFKFWVNILCLCSANNGKIPDYGDVGFTLRMEPEEVARLVKALRINHLLERNQDGSFSAHNWEKWQYKSDVSTERVRRFRERHRNVSETPPDTETESETDTEQKEVVLPPAKKRTAKNTLPDDCPSQTSLENARQFWGVHARFDLIDTISDQAAQFRDHHAKLASRMADWDAAWRTWMRNAINPKFSQKPRTSSHDKGTEGAAIFLAKVASRDRSRAGDRVGKASDDIPANGHGCPEVVSPIRDLQRGFPGQDFGTDTPCLPAMAAKSRQ